MDYLRCVLRSVPVGVAACRSPLVRFAESEEKPTSCAIVLFARDALFFGGGCCVERLARDVCRAPLSRTHGAPGCLE